MPKNKYFRTKDVGICLFCACMCICLGDLFYYQPPTPKQLSILGVVYVIPLSRDGIQGGTILMCKNKSTSKETETTG